MSTFNTEQVKLLLSYAIQGAGFEKTLEISNCLGITVTENSLTFKTTDGTNNVVVSLDVETDEDFDVTVDADLFTKLINKLTSEKLELEIDGNTLVVTANGRYVIALKPNENGDLLQFPNSLPAESEVIGTISKADLDIISHTIKPSLLADLSNVFSSYYFGDYVVSTDRAMLSVLNKKLLDGEYVFDRKFVDLLCMSPDSVTISKADNGVIVSEVKHGAETIKVSTKTRYSASDYNVAGVNKMLSLDIESFCRVRKADLLNLLDRMALFTDKFDNNVAVIEFTNSSMEISSVTGSGVESVDYTESKNAVDHKIKINILRLITQLKAYSSDVVDFYYGSDKCIRLVDGEVTQMIALIL